MHSALASDLRRLLRHSQVVDAPAELRTFSYDASFLTQLSPRAPDVAVIAGAAEDVQALVRYAAERGIPVTPRGAATGQTGGAVALTGGIVLSLNAMNRVLEIDVPNMQVLCEPGVVHAQLNERLARHKLVFPPDPGSSKMATVGGMASTNAHGMRAVKYGPTSAWVLGLEVVLADGQAIEILDERCIQAINLYRPAMQLPQVEALILFEVDGNPLGCRWDAERICEIVGPLALSAEWSDEPARIAALWEARSLVGAAVGTLRPGSNRAYCGEDICVPVSRIPETLRAIQDIGARHRIPIATYGHIGGGGLHPGHLIDGRDADEIRRVLLVADEIHELALRMGGTTTGEHGVGAARAPYMAREHGPALDVMRRIKRALDPTGIMNPGVIFPETVPALTIEAPLVAPIGERPHAQLDPG